MEGTAGLAQSSVVEETALEEQHHVRCIAEAAVAVVTVALPEPGGLDQD